MYGQSVFETIVVANRKAHLLDAHLKRLQQGCDVLSIELDIANLNDEVETAIDGVNGKAILRVSVTMGQGGRGYQNPDNPQPNRILSVSPYPDYPDTNWSLGINLGVARIRLAQQPALAGLKHGNRLEQVIARSQWQDEWQEALLLDYQNQVIEGNQSNVFILINGRLKTPDLSQAGVAGVMRDFVLSNAEQLGTQLEIVPLSIADIEGADAVFMTNSVIGLWPVKAFQNKRYNDFKFSQTLLKVMQDHGAIPNS